MKYIHLAVAVMILSAVMLTAQCTKREMTAEDFLRIEDEVNTTDLTPASKERIAKKHGFSLNQYQRFEERVKSDQKLQEQLGAIRLQKAGK